ncbi:alanine racemase [Aquimarina sp. W85]|uniref:alanine racemase n=1 Tax=Aquimarina rhodophyticola TaxID=3342246 RepID=UPI00366C6A66
MNKVQETTLIINLASLTHNYNYLKNQIKSGVKFLAVVKANAYGNSASQLALHLEKIGVDYFAVAYTAEGIALREAGVKKPILVFHPQVGNFVELISYNLEPSLYSIRILSDFITLAIQKKLTNYPVHLKFNTGLNRIGFVLSEVDQVLIKLEETKTLKITSLFSHLAASEDANETTFTQKQIDTFKTISTKIIDSIGYKPLLHQVNTSGILNYPEAHFDMVRSGIGLYGFGNESKFDKELKPIAALKSIISQIHTLQPGESSGYNRAFIATKVTRSATIPIGHADGIGRIYGHNKGFVIVNNKRASILGIVCMDMLMVDVTAIDCNEGDQVTIFDESYPANILAEDAGTISYELITSMSARIKRVFIEK